LTPKRPALPQRRALAPFSVQGKGMEPMASSHRNAAIVQSLIDQAKALAVLDLIDSLNERIRLWNERNGFAPRANQRKLLPPKWRDGDGD
jgi:hypothetical protein